MGKPNFAFLTDKLVTPDMVTKALMLTTANPPCIVALAPVFNPYDKLSTVQYYADKGLMAESRIPIKTGHFGTYISEILQQIPITADFSVLVTGTGPFYDAFRNYLATTIGAEVITSL